MKNGSIVDISSIQALGNEDFLFDDVKGSTILEAHLRKVKNLSNIDKYILLGLKDKNSETIKNIAKSNGFELFNITNSTGDVQDIIKGLNQVTANYGFDNIVLTYGDSPFLDYRECNKLYNLHLDSSAEYSFGDDYPDGIIGEVLSRDIFQPLLDCTSKKPGIDSRRILENLKTDINKYFVEIQLPERDISLKRLNLTASSERNYELIKRISEKIGTNIDFIDIVDIIEKNPEILHIYPRYVEVEICEKQAVSCIFSPPARGNSEIEVSLYEKIIHELTDKYSDIIVSLGGIGEPLLHTNLDKLLEINKQKGIMCTIIETDGILLEGEIVKKISKYNSEELLVIVSVDAITPEIYSNLRGDNFEKVITNIENFISINKQNIQKLFVQFTEISENRDDLDKFFSFWEKKGIKVILQKFNSFSGQIDNRAYIDLTPLERIPCWHLQRDLYVLSDGRVPVCKQDINCKKIIGNLKDESIENIWDKGLDHFFKDYNRDYSHFEFCQKCDEWYTYNF